MYTPISKKFSGFVQKLIVDKVRELRAKAPKGNWEFSRYNSDDECFQAAITVLEREHKNGTGTDFNERDVLASEIFLVNDESFLEQLAQKALDEAADTDRYRMEKISWEVSTNTH